MSCFGWYDINVVIPVSNEEQAAKIKQEFDSLDIKYRDIYIRQATDKDGSPTLHLERDTGEYYNSNDAELNTIAKWLHDSGYPAKGEIFAEVENEHVRGEFHDGEVQWQSIDWLIYYTNDQIKELHKYAKEHF